MPRGHSSVSGSDTLKIIRASAGPPLMLDHSSVAASKNNSTIERQWYKNERGFCALKPRCPVRVESPHCARLT